MDPVGWGGRSSPEKGEAMRKRWKSGLPLPMAALAAVALFVTACGISNPGTFTTSIRSGSSLTLTDDAGTPTIAFSVGVAPCSDGRDNDLDGRIDQANDSQCDSATDANERIDGVQAYQAPRWQMDVDSGGVITLDPADIVFQPLEECINVVIGIWCMNVTIASSGAPLTGT